MITFFFNYRFIQINFCLQATAWLLFDIYLSYIEMHHNAHKSPSFSVGELSKVNIMLKMWIKWIISAPPLLFEVLQQPVSFMWHYCFPLDSALLIVQLLQWFNQSPVVFKKRRKLSTTPVCNSVHLCNSAINSCICISYFMLFEGHAAVF